jgi:DNA-binding protein|tara:strand:- start:39 stop:377 length:339 start_codon:yes stop_codon:yes gene_type:complete
MSEEVKDKETTKEQIKEKLGDHVVFIGDKPFMNYVTGVVMQFTTQGAEEVVIKSRGRFISRAVDVAEVVRKRFLEGQIDLAPNGIEIGSEEFDNKEGKRIRVSYVEIKLVKK